METTKNIENDGMLIRYVLNQNHDLCLAAVKSDPFSIMYIQDQTPEICLTAVSLQPCAIKYITNQTEELCNLAISKSPDAIKYIRNPTVDMYQKVLHKNGWYINDMIRNKVIIPLGCLYDQNTIEIYNQHQKLYRIAVRQNPSALQFIDDQTVELCMLAVSQNTSSINFVKDLNRFIIWFIWKIIRNI